MRTLVPAGNWRTLRTVAALLPAVAGSIALSIAGLYVARRLVPIEVLRASNNEVGNYLQTVGTIYAVLLAFVVFVVWTQFNDARTLIEREANELLDLYRTAGGLDPSDGAAIQEDVRAYVNLVLAREWTAMARRDDQAFDAGAHLLDRLWTRIIAVEPETDCHRSVFDEILARFNDLSDVRTGRLTASRMRIPVALRILLYFGALITISSMYLLAIDRFDIHAVVTGALGGAVSHVLYIIADLDNPFSGDWQVPRTAFERVARYIDGTRKGD